MNRARGRPRIGGNRLFGCRAASSRAARDTLVPAFPRSIHASMVRP